MLFSEEFRLSLCRRGTFTEYLPQDGETIQAHVKDHTMVSLPACLLKWSVPPLCDLSHALNY